MAKFNTTKNTPLRATSPVKTEPTPTGTTFEGGPGYARDACSELFLLAVANMVGEDTHYEQAHDRDQRYRDLVHQVAVDHPEWTLSLVGWLRRDANMRSAALVAALEAVAARLEAGLHGHNRRIVAAALHRADEPGEALAYWTGRYGRAVPKPVKRGIADAAVRLYTERSLLKYDTESRAFRFGDVIDLTHPAPTSPWQSDLFRHALDRRHGRDTGIPAGLGMLHARAELAAVPVTDRRALLTAPHGRQRLREAGMTWEAVAGWLQGPMDAAAWEALIPSMGYMALLRNLRNFDEAGVSDMVAQQVAARLTDPDEVAASRQFPIRFLAAYKAAPSLRWVYPLEQALNYSLASVPALPGRTLILVDQSGSMMSTLSARSTLSCAAAAQVFGAVLALRAEDATLIQYDTEAEPVPFQQGESVLRLASRFWGPRGGTNTAGAMHAHYRGHDRVVIVTDEQTCPSWTGEGWLSGRVDDLVPRHVPIYTWNLAGYRHGHAPSGTGNRHTFGGLTDAAFRMIPLLEAGRDTHWPWLSADL